MVPVKAFLKERVRLNTWHNSYIDALNGDIAVERLQIRYRAVNQLLTHCEYIGVVALGAILVLKSELSLGMLFAFLGFRQLFVGKCASFIHQLFEYRLITIQLDRLNDIMSQEPEVLYEKIQTIKRPIEGALALQQVSFQYNPILPPILKDLNLHINPGEKVAIVGASGCGKSTLLKMMMGLLTPTAGRILIDGVALDDFGLRNYRLLIASVMQEDALLSGSILENITFFEEEVDLDYAHNVARLVCIDDVIQKLPMGYETRVGDMGSTLSGGQKQRILLARALYKKPSILFLDEATSHLDQENEQRINQALSKLNITQVIVAHRKETIAMADRVVSLSAFKIEG
jgi:ATP-binding cassette subfamily B protein RaxB